MDNRLTRRRLFDLLSYEWIFMIVMCVVAIVFWELIYSVTSVKLTPGQDFKIYYDYTLSSTSDGELRQLIVERKTFSYDVLKFGAEDIDRNNNVLSSRLSIQEGDIIFTDAVGIKEYNEAIKKGETPENPIRAFSVIDTPSCRIASLDEMLSNAQVYLKINFFKDGYNEQTVFDSYDSQNIDHAKVRSAFLKRNGKDNRFRSSSNKEQGIKLEIERIEKLYENVVFMRKFINDNQDSEALVKYTKYSQACIFSIGAAGDYESRLDSSIFAPISGYVAEGAEYSYASERGIYLSSLDAYESTSLSMLPADTVVCIRLPGVLGARDDGKAYAAAEDVLRKILAYNE